MARMKAMVIREFGGPDKLELADMPVPTPGANEVRVRVRASAVNPVDYKIRQSGAWAQVPMPVILGYDAAGVVDAVGTSVVHLTPSDEVFYCARIFGRQGTYAEYHVEDAGLVDKKPPQLSCAARSSSVSDEPPRREGAFERSFHPDERRASQLLRHTVDPPQRQKRRREAREKRKPWAHFRPLPAHLARRASRAARNGHPVQTEDALVERAFECLVAGLEFLGLGAKTAAGYGTFIAETVAKPT